MGLRDIGASLPPGFRFYPSDEELVCHYLSKKISNEEVLKGTLVEIDLHTCEPWHLPEVAKLNSKEWYFFSFRDRKYATGYRANRATTSGYWKATGKDRIVHDPRTRDIVGMRKTLVFYQNRAPNGIKTGWIMHEFRLENPHMPPKEDWVLCRVFYKSKGDDINNFSPQNVFESTTSPYNLATSPTHQSLPCGQYHQIITSVTQSPPHQNQNPSPTLQNQSGLNPNFIQLSQEIININNTPMISEISSKYCGDEYGFLNSDMSFEETNLGDDHGALLPSNLVEMMRFDDDNGLIFF